MQKTTFHKLLWTMFLLYSVAVAQPTEDLENSQDHPLISRFPGYFITSYDQQDFGAFEFQLGEKRQRVEGKYWEFEYEAGEGKKKAGPLQISRNYVTAVSGKGGVKLFEDVDSRGGEATLRFTAEGRSLWIGLDVANSGDFYKLYVIEEAALEQQVSFNAPALAKALEEKGSLSFDTILFDTGTAKLRAESTMVLDQVAQVLKLLDGRIVEVRGHTDNVGNAAANLKLSLDRAEAVKAQLVRSGGIPTDKLVTTGAGDKEPVAANNTDEGRQKNRRVEFRLR